jgi:hypothetical protein
MGMGSLVTKGNVKAVIFDLFLQRVDFL